MPLWSLLIFASALFLQATAAPTLQSDIFTPAEKIQIERETDVQKRIRVYETASKRIQQNLEEFILKENFKPVPETLLRWASLLETSREDIEANLKTKKKSRALIRYEIQVRKSIARTESLKIKAPVDQQDPIDAWIAQAEKVRRRFVEILFRH